MITKEDLRAPIWHPQEFETVDEYKLFTFWLELSGKRTWRAALRAMFPGDGFTSPKFARGIVERNLWEHRTKDYDLEKFNERVNISNDEDLKRLIKEKYHIGMALLEKGKEMLDSPLYHLDKDDNRVPAGWTFATMTQLVKLGFLLSDESIRQLEAMGGGPSSVIMFKTQFDISKI